MFFEPPSAQEQPLDSVLAEHVSRRIRHRARLSWLLGGVSMRSGDEDAGVITMGLWLWPSPPRETFEFGVEWPAGALS